MAKCTRAVFCLPIICGFVQDQLIKSGKNKFGWTPLHLAAREGHIDIVQMLLEAGANIGAKNKFGRTPLDYAVKHRHTDIVRMLVSNKYQRDENES